MKLIYAVRVKFFLALSTGLSLVNPATPQEKANASPRTVSSDDGLGRFASSETMPFEPKPLSLQRTVANGQINPNERIVPDFVSTLKPGTSFDSAYGSTAYGTSPQKWPYSISRVAVTGTPGPATGSGLVPVSSRPYRLIGALYMRFGTTWRGPCTAALIKRGVVVTAAHCVHNYGEGQNGFASEVRWYPSWSLGSGPWSWYNGMYWRITVPHYYGTDTCRTSSGGLPCNNDLAVVALYHKNGILPGSALGGWLSYGWNGFGFVTSPAFGGQNVGSLTQFGYPTGLDNGQQMLRNDSMSKRVASIGASGRTLVRIEFGSPMSQGASGGPVIANFGSRPTVTGSASLGTASTSNVVVGVVTHHTEVGGVSVNVQGATAFGQNPEYPDSYGTYGAGNIGSLMQITCGMYPSHC